MSAESEMFEYYLKNINNYLKPLRLSIDQDDRGRNFKERLKQRWVFMLFFLNYSYTVVFELGWFIHGIMIGKRFNELTYVCPCFTYGFLGGFKVISFLYYAHYVIDIISTLRGLQNQNQRLEILGDVKGIDKKLKFLKSTVKGLEIVNFTAPVIFGLCTLFLTLLTYLQTEKLELHLPFYVLYPFNVYDLRVYPFVLLHQIWCSYYAVLGIMGVDGFFYSTITFIHIQLCCIQLDASEFKPNELNDVNLCLPKLRFMLKKHIQLIGCINMLKVIYSMTTLFNIVSSSLILCLAGFNIIAGEDMFVIFSFTSFFVMSLVQIFLFCLYGDMLSSSTVECSYAVYDSKWYIANVAVKKDLLFILARCQKPCKLTASGFMDIDLKAFARIVSTSWSYFALVSTMYRNGHKL